MSNILMLSQKGGVGKTTIADDLAYMFEADGAAVSFLDLDPQGGALHKEGENAEAEITIIDTPGYLLPETPSLIENADAVIIPTRASVRDMDPLTRMRDAVTTYAPDTPVCIIVNGWNHYKNARDYMDWLDGDLRDTETVLTLSQSERIPQAAMEGQSVTAFAPRSKPAEQMKAIYTAVRERAGMTAEAKNDDEN